MNNSIAFPYPVLGRSDDYKNVEFQVALREPNKTGNDNEGTILIPYMFDLSDDALLQTLDRKEAKLGFEIICKNTALRYVEFADENGTLEIPIEAVHGRVELLPCIFATAIIENFRSENFNDEFGDSSFTIFPGDVLAEADPDAINIEFGNLTFESLLKVVKATYIDPYSYEFSLDGNTIQIAMGEQLFETWGSIKDKKEIRPFLVMSIYKDCIVSALETLVRQRDTELSWANSLTRMLEKADIELPSKATFSELNLLAQKILKDKGIKRIANGKY